MPAQPDSFDFAASGRRVFAMEAEALAANALNISVAELAELCDRTALEAGKELADLSDPLLDVLAQQHSARERPLFVS